mgnify:CR=1 FL=1
MLFILLSDAISSLVKYPLLLTLQVAGIDDQLLMREKMTSISDQNAKLKTDNAKLEATNAKLKETVRELQIQLF